MLLAFAASTLILAALIYLNSRGIFDFDDRLVFFIAFPGIPTSIAPFILYRAKVSDKFLKYYMAFSMAFLIGILGCFSSIGIYISFALVPVASVMYFDPVFTVICSIFSYLMMVIAVFINCFGKYEVTELHYSHKDVFVAYITGFTLEYFIMAVCVIQILRRAMQMLNAQHESLLLLEAQGGKYDLLLKESSDVIFEYYPWEKRYSANRSIFQEKGAKNERVESDCILNLIEDHPQVGRLLEHMEDVFRGGDGSKKVLDMSHEHNGVNVPLWYTCECFVVKDGDRPVSIIGKLHNITRSILLQEQSRRQRISEYCSDDRRRNSLYEKVVADSINFSEHDYSTLAQGHQFIARLMENAKYQGSPVDAINIMLKDIGSYFHLDRIIVVEADATSGSNTINYQWNRKETDHLENFFTEMSRRDYEETIAAYNEFGYLECNPEQGIITAKASNSELYKEVIENVILGNQIWIPTMSEGEYTGAVYFDKYDTTRYTSVDKFLLAEAVNTIYTYIMKVNAENANKAKSDFLSTMSHEIRTPMNAIVGMTEVALREETTPSVRNKLQMVKSSAFGLLTLINDILDYSKIEAGRFEIVPENFSILSLMNDVREIVKARNNGKLEIRVNVPDNLPSKIRADAVRIRQVMINFCTNAIKYTDEGYIEMRVSVARTDENTGIFAFKVKDTGIGIKSEDLHKLFKSYTQVDTTVNHHKEGTGLGLAISRQLVELMDGAVHVTSEYGKGSEFSFFVPVDVIDWTEAGELDSFSYDDSSAENSSSSGGLGTSGGPGDSDGMGTSGVSGGSGISGGSKPGSQFVIAPTANVLIVDDTELNLMVAEALMEPTRMQIDTAESGMRALEMLGEKKYDIIFMDHFMPEMDGVETTQKIRALSDNQNSATPIIALTADAMAGVREELLGAGMDDFMTKPIIMETLNQILRKWLPEEKVEE